MEQGVKMLQEKVVYGVNTGMCHSEKYFAENI